MSASTQNAQCDALNVFEQFSNRQSERSRRLGYSPALVESGTTTGATTFGAGFTFFLFL